MSGFELAEQFAAGRAAIPIIFITAHDDTPTRERVRQAGVAAYLPKPFDERVLLDAIRRALGVDGRSMSRSEARGSLVLLALTPEQGGSLNFYDKTAQRRRVHGEHHHPPRRQHEQIALSRTSRGALLDLPETASHG